MWRLESHMDIPFRLFLVCDAAEADAEKHAAVSEAPTNNVKSANFDRLQISSHSEVSNLTLGLHPPLTPSKEQAK